MQEEPEVIGEKLKRLRLQEGLSKAELARRAGLTRRTLSYIERNVTEPHRSTRLMLSEALGVPPDELAEGCCSPRATQKSAAKIAISKALGIATTPLIYTTSSTFDIVSRICF